MKEWGRGAPAQRAGAQGLGVLTPTHMLEVSLVAQTVLVSTLHCRAPGEASCPVSHPVAVR